MLLETLDIKKDDIVIYSQNIFDLDNNFKIIFKDDPEKKKRKIGFYDVCDFVNEYTPKNLIVYRLMTNINDFELYSSKFGFKVYISEEPEIIYFDPVFAIRELEEYPGTVDENIRFRIQQIGLTTLSRIDNVSNFAEIYSIDLRPHEAKFQKDKVFADAIFALNADYNSTDKSISKTENSGGNITPELQKRTTPVLHDNLTSVVHENNTPVEQEKPTSGINENATSLNNIKKDLPTKSIKKDSSLSSIFKNVRNESKLKVKQKGPAIVNLNTEFTDEKKEDKTANNESGINPEDIKFIKHDIGEDKNFDYKQILKMKFKKTDDDPEPINEFPRIMKHSTEEKNAFREFLQTKVSPVLDKKVEEKKGHLLDIFKSPEPLKKLVKEREKEKVVLKLNRK